MTLLHDALEAYLGPLLKKHNNGTYLTWEDLTASKAAATKVLEGSDNIFVSKKLDALHESQVNAYKEAGTKALKEFAEAMSLEPMEEGDSKETFVRRCVLAIRKTELPLWPGIENFKKLVREEVQKRALATFEKYHPAEGSEELKTEPSAESGAEPGAEPSEGEGEVEGDTEPDQSEEGEAEGEGEAMTDEEEGEEEEEDGEVEQKSDKPAAAPKGKNKVNNKNNPKKKVVRKKGAGAKSGIRKNFAGNRRGKKNAPGNKSG
ncbi:unnamed protein product [Cylindrotheca closterium]|uniref:Uncharacterized protein n=1 Tax=Cylindrotheca closterium TaxID=2856 RepID=A0AAD2FR33_9STRA|nr:unnamed protein product [Cylindrotheca closterium]